jgi:hypothetical protein
MMTEPHMQTPLAIDRVERARAKRDQVRLRLSGHWLTDPPVDEEPALLVVQLHGRRMRFAASGGEEPQGECDTGAGLPFSASFTVPDWAVPEQPGQAVLWVGEAIVPVPPPGMAALAPVAPSESVQPAGALSTPRQPSAPQPPFDASPSAASQPSEGQGSTASGSGRSGPLAQLLYKDTVTALHAELEQRTAESARLRSALAAAHSDLQGGSSARSELEAAHSELRDELQSLMRVASDQREEFERQLAEAGEERDRLSTAVTDAAQELARTREELEGVLAEAGQERGRSEERLAELRDALDRAREAGEDRLAAARSEFDQRLAGARSEAEAALAAARREAESALAAARGEAETALGAVRVQAEADVAQAAETARSQERERAESELAGARAESEAMLGAARSHSDAQAVAAAAQIRELTDRVAVLQGGERQRDDEARALREQLAASHIARDAALAEADGLRTELDRLGGELAVLREQSGPPGGDLSEARQLLADARALTQRLRGDTAA